MVAKYILSIPMPIDKIGINTRLAGFAYCLYDQDFNKLHQDIFYCNLSLDKLPSPIFLYALGINPNNLKDHLSEYDFFNKILSIIKDKKLTLITYGANYFEALNSLSIRNLYFKNILDEFVGIVDLNTALNTANIFGNLKLANQGDLLKKALSLGFNINNEQNNSFINKLNALEFIFKKLYQSDPKIISYLLSPYEALMNLYQNCIKEQKFLCTIDNKSKKIGVFLAKECKSFMLQGYLYIDNEVKYAQFNLHHGLLLSPVSILTEQRQQELKINLKDIEAKVKSANIKPHNSENFYIKFIDSLSENDRNYFEKINENGLEHINSIPINLSNEHLSLMLFLFKARNFKGTLTPSELNKYYKICAINLNKNLNNYNDELLKVCANINEDDTKGINLINLISSYPQNI